MGRRLAACNTQVEGKVCAIGLSNHDPVQLDAAEALGHVDTLQPPFSAIHRETGEPLPWTATMTPASSPTARWCPACSPARSLVSGSPNSPTTTTGAIVGARSPRQVEGWLAAASAQLTTNDLDMVADAIVAAGAGEGPTRP